MDAIGPFCHRNRRSADRDDDVGSSCDERDRCHAAARSGHSRIRRDRLTPPGRRRLSGCRLQPIDSCPQLRHRSDRRCGSKCRTVSWPRRPQIARCTRSSIHVMAPLPLCGEKPRAQTTCTEAPDGAPVHASNATARLTNQRRSDARHIARHCTGSAMSPTFQFKGSMAGAGAVPESRQPHALLTPRDGEAGQLHVLTCRTTP